MKKNYMTLLGASLMTLAVSAFADDTAPALQPVTAASNQPLVLLKPDLWELVATDVAKMDGKTMTKDDLSKAFTAQFPDGKIPENITQQQIVSAAPQFLRQHIQTLLLVDLAKDRGIPMDADIAYKQMKTEWTSLSGQEAEQLKAELAEKKTTLDDYAKQLSTKSAIQDTLRIQNWLKKKMAEQPPVTDADIRKFYDDNQTRLQPVDGKAPGFDVVAPQIRAYLESQKQQQFLTAQLADAEKSRKVEYLLAVPPRGFGGCAPSGCTPTCN